jgi:hypothetical protein
MRSAKRGERLPRRFDVTMPTRLPGAPIPTVTGGCGVRPLCAFKKGVLQRSRSMAASSCKGPSTWDSRSSRSCPARPQNRRRPADASAPEAGRTVPRDLAPRCDRSDAIPRPWAGSMARANCWPPSSPASCRVRPGFNSLDIAQLNPTSLLATDLLMFVDGGSAGTAGGIKITTFGLLASVIWAELRGEPGEHRAPEAGRVRAASGHLDHDDRRRLGRRLHLRAVRVHPHSLDQVLFEVISAFGTVGLTRRQIL